MTYPKDDYSETPYSPQIANGQEVSQNDTVDAKSPKPGELVVQPNGRGALRHGSEPGTNKPGKGRPANWWRQMCQDGLYRARTVETMVGIISGDIAEVYFVDGVPVYTETKNSDRIKAAAFLAGYAYGQPKATVTHEGEGGPGRTPMSPVELLEAFANMKRNLEELAKPAPQHRLPKVPPP